MLSRNLLLLIAALAFVPNFAFAQEPALDLGGVTEKHIMMPMRDGKKLSTYLYFPKGQGPWPVIYEQRYADLRGAETRKSFARLAAGGYVVAAQNFRGTHLSEDAWVGYRALGWGEKKDGYDTVEWLAKQPWSTGKIGTVGSSQAGFAQNFLAVTRPPHLVCQYMIDTGLSLFHEGYRIGGTTRPERFKQMEAVCRDAEDNRRLMKEWFAHPTYDAYWAEEDCTRFFDKMNVPCFTIGSWYDFMCVGSIDSYIGRQHRGGPKSRGQQQLLLGPWLHGRDKNTNKANDMTYPENAKFAMEQHMLRWFDHYLKGIDNGVERDPAVRYYVMGALGDKDAPGNVWRNAADWPVPAKATAYYLRAGGQLSGQSPEEEKSTTTFLADPLHPNEIPGRAFPGGKDARPFEKQAEVRTFTTAPLTDPVEWTGKVQAELYVSSTAKDTDFIVRVSDVYPDGRSILLMDYVRRARYRDGYDKEVFLTPGQVHKVAFDVGWISQVFNRGHRIRVTVASTGPPFYEPNPNTGEPLTIEPPQKTLVAKNAVHHERQYASRVLAPVAVQADKQPSSVSDMLPDLRLLQGPWRPGPIHRESLLFLQAKDGPPTARLLFDVEKILAFHSADGKLTYEAGKDYQLAEDGSRLLLPPGSPIPFRKETDLFPPKARPHSIPHRTGQPDTSVYFAQGHFFHDLQVEVSYLPRKESKWTGYVPTFVAKHLPATIASLRNKKPLTLAVSGDSISEGYNASGFTKAPPFMPSYSHLVAAQLEKTYGGKITHHNRAIAGWSVGNGVQDIDKLLKTRPDLVIVAYSMNDVGRRNPEAFKEGIAKILSRIQEVQPAAEVILVAGMTGNADWVHTPSDMFPKYRDVLATLSGPGVAFVDLTAVWLKLLERKRFVDMTGNGVNHPNDYGHRLYAQAILALLVESKGGTP